MALREIRVEDWWRVFRRELVIGTALGSILGTIGLVRVFAVGTRGYYGDHYQMLAFTVSASLVGTVLWGSLTGSMLPFLLKRLNFDPATASAPFVATIVDVSGLLIYFTAASFFLKGLLL